MIIILAILLISHFYTVFTGIWIYDFVGKHTLGPMAIWIMLILLSLVGCFILYKQLGPMNVSNRMKKCEDNKVHKQVANMCKEYNEMVHIQAGE